MTRFAAWVDMERLEVRNDRPDAGLSRVRAIAVGAAAGRWFVFGTSAVAVFCVPVIGAGGRVRILDFTHHSLVRRSYCNLDTVRWHERRRAVGIVEVDGVALTEHDVVGAR